MAAVADPDAGRGDVEFRNKSTSDSLGCTPSDGGGASAATAVGGAAGTAVWLTAVVACGGALADGVEFPQDEAQPASMEHSNSDAALSVRSPRASASLFGPFKVPMDEL